ncbi:MAG: LuxR C-terminal-related transcriptional regulator [Eubacteriaceae bacterium]|nr:LuxR C-terminal-related transcriptional regulator [Eubacteriaceae bacterium]
MRHLIAFGYLISILMGGTILTFQFANSGYKDSISILKQPFFLMLLVMNFWDLIIYYCQDIAEVDLNGFLVSLGDLLFAILVLCWLKVLADICKDETCYKVARITRTVVFIYIAIWMTSAIVYYEAKWIRIVIDLPVMAVFVLGSVHSLVISFRDKKKIFLKYYIFLNMSCMFLIYLAYFMEDAGLTAPPDRKMEYTIFFWLVINTINLMMLNRVYRSIRDEIIEKTVMTPDVSSNSMNMNEILDNLEIEYELTKREREILEELCRGKTNLQIAETLFISESTVKAHMYNTFKKIGVKNRVEAIHLVNTGEHSA